MINAFSLFLICFGIVYFSILGYIVFHEYKEQREDKRYKERMHRGDPL